jgi:hypothetical protein
MRKNFLFILLFLPLAGGGCDDGGDGGQDDADAVDLLHDDADAAGDPDPADAPDIPTEEASDVIPDGESVEDVPDEEAPPAPAPLAFTTNSAYDYSSGSYSVLLDDLTAVRDVAAIHPDAVVRCTQAGPLILERFGADTVTRIAGESPFAVLGQFSVEGGSNPVDLALLSSGRVVVTRNNVTAAAVVDLGDGTLDTTSLDLAALADDDGIPEMSAVFVAGGRLFIAIQLLDRDTAMWDPTGPGLVAVFDEATLAPVDADPTTEPVDAITLGGLNPQAGAQPSPMDATAVFIAEVGFYGAADGGIETIDTAALEPGGWIVTEETLGGDIAAFVVVDAGTGWAAVSRPEFAGDKLVRFDPADGTIVEDAVIESEAYTLTAMTLTADGRLLVADRTLEHAGVRVLDAGTGDEAAGSPVGMGLAPFSICAP